MLFLNFITVLIPSTSSGFPISQRLTQVEVPFPMATIRASPVWDIHHLYNPISMKSIFDDVWHHSEPDLLNYLLILSDPSFLCFWCFCWLQYESAHSQSYTFAPKLLGLRRLLVGAKHDVKSSFQGLGMLDIDTSVRKTSITWHE